MKYGKLHVTVWKENGTVQKISASQGHLVVNCLSQKIIVKKIRQKQCRYKSYLSMFYVNETLPN
jgi:hypothetical protein